jgi:hypothetical protein
MGSEWDDMDLKGEISGLALLGYILLDSWTHLDPGLAHN